MNPPKRRADAVVRLTLKPTGELSNPRAEIFALYIADDVPPPTAWVHAGGKDKGGSVSYRRQIEENPVFKQRLESLMAEKAELEKDPLFGEAKWMAAQLWRDARAAGDIGRAHDAAKLRWNISQKEAETKPAPPPEPGPSAPSRGPGRPSQQNPQASLRAAEMKEKLIGMKTPPGSQAQPAPAPAPAPPPPTPPADDEHLERMLARALPG